MLLRQRRANLCVPGTVLLVVANWCVPGTVLLVVATWCVPGTVLLVVVMMGARPASLVVLQGCVRVVVVRLGLLLG